MRAMLDTNILISILLFNSHTATAFIHKVTSGHEIILCDYVIDELFTVAERKFKNKLADLKNKFALLEYQELNTKNINIKTRLPPIRDYKDSPILYAAVNANIDYFVTGDKDFLAVKDLLLRPQIISMTDFIKS